ncbi:VOC family protein [Halomarina oriensis]|uniref:VOC family protein n=1 Tax=Halomarina oriensis TaxID=671145 RepID=A0A6B0GWB5_9EURY|nr:VOC family protein [Halomarina oriensis]MWG36028.1 VOC family protein [Halomarina oriensis]
MHGIHVRLFVTDADASADWYVEQLDFEHSWAFSAGDQRHVYVADENGFELQLTETEGEQAIAEADTVDHLALGVEDVDAAFDAIENHGVVKDPGDQPEAGARTAFLEDPDGNVVELVQPLD